MKKLLIGLVFLMHSTVAVGQDVPLSVACHVDVSYHASTFDEILDDVNLNALALDNQVCSDDVPCTVRFVRDGNLGGFGTSGDGLNVIDTLTKLDAVLDIYTHYVKVVDQILVCDGGINPSILGCAGRNGQSFIVTSLTPGDVYAHEYGHSVGLPHRNDCVRNIMHEYLRPTDSINTAECLAFGGRVYTQLCGNVYDGSGGPLTASGGPYWITCNLTVPLGQNLTIQGGVEIQFHSGTRILSEGRTIIDGSTDRIILYANTFGFKRFSLEDSHVIVDGDLTIENGGELVFPE